MGLELIRHYTYYLFVYCCLKSLTMRQQRQHGPPNAQWGLASAQSQIVAQPFFFSLFAPFRLCLSFLNITYLLRPKKDVVAYLLPFRFHCCVCTVPLRQYGDMGWRPGYLLQYGT